MAAKIGRWLDILETRLSLVLHGVGLVGSFSLPAWATWAAGIFSQYAPLSWVVAGFLGVGLGVLFRLIWHWAGQMKVRAKYDALQLEKGSLITPLDLTFERKRILVNDFVLPSHPFIDGKTFIDCDIVGPACIYFSSNNQANPIRPPKVDAVWLEPGAKFNNGFIFTNCIFRNCSFQRITIFASVENFHAWKDLDSVNWISIPPTEADLQKRLAILKTDHAIEKSAALAKQAEAEKQAEKQVEQMMKFEPEKEQTSS
jgi:hypothetical protein